jgi:hypothetical protein
MTGPSAEDRLPTVSIIIMTGGDREVFDRSLAAALADPATAEVVVVSDHEHASPRGRERFVALREQAAVDPRLRIVDLPDDLGDGLWRVQRGRDAGVHAARSEIVLLLDDDVVLDPGTVGGHARSHARESDLVMVGYMPVATRHRWPRGNATVGHYSDSYEGTCKGYESDEGAVLKGLWGGNVSLRRADWLRAAKRPRVGAWGHDDQEIGLLLLREGLHARFDRSLRGEHFYERSLAGFVERAERSPRGQRRLALANPDLLDPSLNPRDDSGRLPSILLRAARTRVGWAVIKNGLFALLIVAGVLRRRRLGRRAVTALWILTGSRDTARPAAARDGTVQSPPTRRRLRSPAARPARRSRS